MNYRIGQLAQNRLLNLRTDIILTRRFLYPPAGQRSYAQYLQFAPGGGWPPVGAGLAPGIEIQHPDFRTLEAIQANPSPDELFDLGLIDAFYGPIVSPVLPGENSSEWAPYGALFGNMTPAQVRGYYMCRVPEWESQAVKETSPVVPVSSAPFACPTEPDLPDPYSEGKPNDIFMAANRVGGGAWAAGVRFNRYPPRVAFWDRALGSPWAELKPAVPNYVEIERVLETYPFPAPFQRDYAFILGQHIIPELRAFAQQPGVLNDVSIRVWLTMTVLSKYEAMVAALEDYTKEQEENARRRLMVQAIGIAGVGAIIGAGLAAAAVSATMTSVATKGIAAIGTAFSKEQQADMAKELAAAQLALQDENPAFSSEIKFAQDVLKFMSENTEDLSRLSPEDQARVLGAGDGLGTIEIVGLGAGALIALYLAGAFE